MNKTIQKLKKLNDAAAVKLSNFYAWPLMIWLSIVFSIIGGFVSSAILSKMLYWSNSFQLVFCFVSVYVAVLNVKMHNEVKQTHAEMHAMIKDIHAQAVKVTAAVDEMQI